MGDGWGWWRVEEAPGNSVWIGGGSGEGWDGHSPSVSKGGVKAWRRTWTADLRLDFPSSDPGASRSPLGGCSQNHSRSI